jgi:hypothetical protein
VSLANAKFGAGDRIGYAFALVGFQAACSQSYYSLVVDVVEFQNSNTQMYIVVDFRNPALNTLTTWTNVQLSYITASSNRYETLPVNAALIWATNIEVSLTAGSITNLPILTDGFFNHVSTDGLCGLTYTGSAYVFSTACTVAPGFSVAVHSYIMGFQFQPDTNIDQYLAASITWPTLSSSNNLQIGQDSAATVVPNGIQIKYNTAAGSLTGPLVTLNNYNGQLQSIKVAFVFTVINSYPLDNGVDSTFQYSYSGLYVAVSPSTFGVETLMQNTDTYNKLLLQVPTTKYMIFGLSSFVLLDGSSCTSVQMSLAINTPNAYTFTANNANYTQSVIFQADIYTANNGALCNAQIEFSSLSVSSPATTNILTNARGTTGATTVYNNLVYKLQRLSEVFTTYPTNTVNQYIYQANDNPLDLTFYCNGLAGDNTYVKFHASVIINNITSGKPYGVRVQNIPTGTFAADPNAYYFNVAVNGFNLYTNSYNSTQLTGIGATGSTIDEQFYGVNLNGTTANFTYDLWIPRNNATTPVNYNFEIQVDLYEFQEVYDPIT